ncbi:Dynein heavy chain 2, axonemal [Rhizophlyctis rosea]|uniref:Dynein heavy chain 2, axonemal n=1 Tax=Rhizophlyctis rosea TaxID=64517 RepID=A0AAD5SCH1_9FUNG|nr:Dynein heavy chain 2, axonemal [Rhizophlyctis rosea]
MLRAINATSSHPSEEHHNFVDAPNAAKASDSDDRWARAEHKWLEIFFSTEEGGMTSTVKGVDSLGRPLLELERVIKVSFNEAADRLSNITGGSNGRAGSGVRRQDDVLRKTQGGKGRIVRPRTADLSKQQRKMLEEFRVLDQYIFIREDDPRVIDDSSTRIRKETSISTYDASPPNDDQPSADLAATASQSEIILPKHARPLSREGREILREVVTSASRASSTLSKALVDQSLSAARSTLKASKPDLAPSADSDHHETALPGLPSPTIKAKLPPSMSQRHVPEDYVDLPQKNVRTRNITNRFKIPRVPHLPRLTPASSRMVVSMGESNRDVRQMSWGVKLETPVKADHSIEEEFPMDDSLLAGSNASRSLTSSLECIEDTMSAFGVPYEDRRLMQLRALSTYLTTQHDQSHRATRRIGHIFPLDYFMDFEETLHLLRNIHLPSFRARNIHHHDSADFIWDSPSSSSSLSSWRPCKVVQFDPVQKLFEIEFEGSRGSVRAHSIWVTKCDVLPPWESEEGMRRKLVTAQVMRAEFEYFVTLREWVAIARPQLEKLVPEFPSGYVEGLLKKVIASRSWRGVSGLCSHDDGFGEEEDGPTAFADCSIELAELRNHYFDSQVRATLIQISAFREHVPLSVIFDSYHQMFRKSRYLESVQEGSGTGFTNQGTAAFSVSHLVKEVGGELIFLKRPVADVLAWVKEELGKCLGPTVYESFAQPLSDSHRQQTERQCSMLLTSAQSKSGNELGDLRTSRLRSSAAPRRESMLNLLSSEDLDKSGAVVAEMDEDGVVHVSPSDFQKYSKAFQTRFVTSVGSAAAEIIGRGWQDIKDSLRGGGDHGGEETYGSRLSRMVSTLAESYALPFLRHRIMETYQLFKEGKLVILLNLVVQSSATEEGNAITPLTIDYDTPLTQVSEHVLDALTRWLDPVECILPDGIMTSTPADHRYIETLCKDLISDAASAASDFLTEIRKSLIPRIRSASRPLISNGSSESYLGVCKAVMRDLDQIGGGLGRLPGRMKRGVFEIRTEVMRGMIEGWVEKARKSTLRVIAKRVRDELGKLKGADWFFGLVLPGTFDETKVAISVLGELRAEIPKLEQQSGLTKALKAFLNDCLYSLDDDTVAQFYGTYTLHSRLAEFLATSETEVSNTVSRLRVTLDREVNMFVGVQREVESKLRKLLEDPIVADVIVKPANAQRARLSGIKTHITDAIEIGRAIQQKADCIQDGVIKGRLATIDAELNDWLVLVNGVVDMYENVCGWRNNPISGLDMSKVIERSSELQNVMQSTVLRSCAVVKRADEELTHFIINQLPVLRIVTDRGLRSWHWERIVQILGLPADTDQDTVSLAELLVNARQLQDVLSALRVVAEEGDKELSLRGTIETVSERFDTLQLALHEDSDIPFPAITSFDAAISSLESDQLTLSMLNSSPFSQRYASSISRVKGELNTALEILKQWSILQPLMQKVHSFFVTDQVRLQLAAELKRYRGIEGSYRAVMVRFVRSGRAIRKFTVSTDGMLHMLEGMNSKLQRIVEDFQSWLDNKRHTFPRLFCLADDELLDLVSNATKPDEVSLCLTKLFRIRRLIHKKDASAEGDFRILGIESPEGEKLHFRNPISTKSYTVEVWMTRLNGEIQSSLKEMVLSNLRETSKGLKSSVWERDIRNVIDSSALGQVKILLIQILTTATLEGLIQTSASDLQQMREKVQNSVELLGELLRNRSGNGISQLAWGALISVLIGYRDWVAQLAEEKVQSLDEFAWMAGLRYRHDEEELAVTVEQSMYSAQYGFDYLGPDLALPTLPLHSAFAKVWLANHSRYGVVAIGEHPGKTHFLRMHLTSLGRYAIEFSLNKNIMPAAVARLLIGAALGVSIVFRHVDRLNAESFSTWVSGMESMRYLTGRQDLTVGSFLGRAVKLTPTDCLNCFATLSRATEGSVSADTIEKVRSHNRVLSISPPDLVAISVGIFERYGLHSSDLGLKLGTFFKMGPTLLHHIDFTLRGLKAVFTIFQKLRETETEKSEPEALTAAIDVLIRGQLATNDIIIFDTLIKKVFGVANSDGPAGHLQAERSALRTAVDGGQHIVMVEKHRGAALKIIQNCAEERGANVHFINTTAIEGALLLGQQTAAGSINGVIANVISSHLKSDNAQTWLVFEAVDSEMEDYLYDLGAGDAGMCLVTGRRIVLPQKCTIIIQASESLSRMSDNFSTIRVREIWSWRAELMEWEVKIFGGKASTENQSQVCSTIANLSSMLFSEMWRLWGAHAVIDERTSYKGLLKILYCNLQEGGLQRYCASSAFILEAFISALIWTVGNALPPLARVDFQEQLIRWLESNVRICGFLSAWKQTLKSGGSIFDLRFDVLLAKWCPASSAASNPAAIRNGILNLLLSHGISVCAIGDVNIGKRDTVLGLLSSNSSALVTHFLGRGESLKAVLQQNLFETAAGLCAPIKDKKLVIFMEEANATAAEAFKLLHTEGGYWCNSGTFRKVRGVSAVVAVDVCLKERKWHTPFEDGDFMLMCFWANDFWGDEVATFVKRLPSTGTADQILAAAEATSSVRQQLQLMDHGNIGRNTLAKRLLQLLRELLLLGETDAGLSRAKLANVWLTELSNDFSSIFGDDLIWRNLWEWCRRSFNVSSKYVETNRQTSPELLRPVRVRNLPEVLESQPKFMSPVTRAAPFKKIVERMRVNFSLSGRHSVLNVPSDIDGCHSDEVVHSAASLEGCNVVEYCADDDPTAIEWSVCLRKLILSVAGTNRRSVLYLKLCKIPLAPACCMDLKLMLQSSLMMHLWRSSELDDILRNGKNQQQSASQLGALHQLGKDAGLKITLLLVVSPDSINVHGHYLADIRPRLVTYELPSLSQGLLKEIAQVRLRSVAMVVDVHSLSELVAEVFLVTVNTNAKAAGQFPVSSANFVEFLETFIRILETRTSALQNEAKDVQAALDNIQGAENLMLKRCEEAQKQMTDLPDILRKLDDENTALIEERNNVLKSIEKCQQDIRDAERNANIRKREMEADLVRRSMEAAKTAYDGSLERLQSIGKDDIEELKSFSIPPPTVELLGVALCLVFDRKTTWAEGKKLISSHSFLARMAMLEPKSLASSKVQRLQKMLESPVVQPDRLYSALDSVRTMFAWLRATCQYATEHLSSRAGTIKRVESSDPTVRDKLELELEGLIQRHRNVSDRLSDVTDRLNRETGHLALLREIFNASNIFGPDDDPEGEAQWIQQAFHSTERNVLFETEKVALAHDKYQLVLNQLADLQESLAEERNETDKLLDNALDLIRSLTPSNLFELVRESEQNQFSNHAWRSLQKVFNLSSTGVESTFSDIRQKLRSEDLAVVSQNKAKALKTIVLDPLFQQAAFYDRNMAATSAVKPVEGCKAAFVVREVTLLLHTFNGRRERLETAVAEARHKVADAKSTFDARWIERFGDVYAFWTFERIIAACRQVPERLKRINRKSLLADLSATTIHPLLSRVLQAVCALIGWESESTALRKRVLANSSEFFEVLSKLDVSSQRVYDIVQAHFQTRELKDLSVQIQHQYGRVYLDVITSLPEELSVVILSLLDDRSLCRSAGVSSKWHALLQKQPMWRWFCHRRGWGIAFTYSPSMNWKRLYGSLTKGAQKRTKLIETEFLQYLSGSVGISAYKKAAGFLKKVPEYSALEKSIAMTLPQMEVITRLELTGPPNLTVLRRKKWIELPPCDIEGQ